MSKIAEPGGIVAFVTNGGFIDSNAFDGFRKAVSQEFHSIYCFDLRGDQRTAGETSRREGGKIFGSGSRASVAILLLVKKPGKSDGATILYKNIGDYLTQDQKLEILNGCSLSTTEWQEIVPNEHGDWINPRTENYHTLRPLAPDRTIKVNDKTNAPVFNLSMPGVNTAKDGWCYNSSRAKLRINIQRLTSQTKHKIDEHSFRTSTYRPFFKQTLYYNREINARPSRFNEVFPQTTRRKSRYRHCHQGS